MNSHTISLKISSVPQIKCTNLVEKKMFFWYYIISFHKFFYPLLKVGQPPITIPIPLRHFLWNWKQSVFEDRFNIITQFGCTGYSILKEHWNTCFVTRHELKKCTTHDSGTHLTPVVISSALEILSREYAANSQNSNEEEPFSYDEEDHRHQKKMI